MMLAYLITGGKTVALTTGAAGIRWESADPRLAEDARLLVPPGSIPESGGNPAAWAIRRLEQFMPGRTCVVGGNIAPGDKHYGMEFP